MPRQTSVQITEATDRQIEYLSKVGFGSFTDITRIAIDRMYQQEIRASSWKVSFYYDNPKRNHKTFCETREEAIEESLERLEVVSYIENERTGEWAKREAHSSEFDWFPKK